MGGEARTLDSPHKCLIPKIPETTPFCPDKIFEIWAFLSEMAPDFPAGTPNLSKHGSNLRNFQNLAFKTLCKVETVL